MTSIRRFVSFPPLSHPPTQTKKYASTSTYILCSYLFSLCPLMAFLIEDTFFFLGHGLLSISIWFGEITQINLIMNFCSDYIRPGSFNLT